MAKSALKGETGYDFDGYRDYRGVLVVGAWSWLPEFGLGVASEMDYAEVFSLPNQNGNQVVPGFIFPAFRNFWNSGID